MGLYDRDYYRTSSAPTGRYRGGGLVAVRMWSVNTWLIVLCVGVFAIDSMLPKHFVESGYRQFFENVQFNPAQCVVQAVPPKPITIVDQQNPAKVVKQFLGRPVLAFAGGPQIGWAEVVAMHPMQSLMYFSTARVIHRVEWWRFVGFQFLHASWMHVLLNMLGLYFFGPMVEQYLGGKRYLAFYLLCGIFGALMYLLLNLGGFIASEVVGSSVHIPGLLFNDVTTPLIGASAGVFGVIMAGAFLAPDAVVYVFFLLPARLATVAYILVGMALLSVFFSGDNAGGEAAHLGGAMAGFYFIRHPRHLHGFFDVLGRADPTSHHYRPKPGAGDATVGAGGGGADRREIDRILDKIKRTSIHSLSDDEKRILREASER